MKIVVFGLSITSAWGNGHATTFRALLKALHNRKHEIVFFERETDWYSDNRDLPDPRYCKLVLYGLWSEALPRARKELDSADVGMVGSYFPDGITAVDELLNSRATVKTFYDIDTPITIAALREKGKAEYLKAEQVPGLDVYFSFTGGPLLREIEDRFGAKLGFPLYCSVDPAEYCRFATNKRFACDLSYMGTYAPDRQAKLEDLLVGAAVMLPKKTFIVAGSQYPKRIRWPKNIRRISHLNPKWHALFYSSSRLTLNVTRREMVIAGYSPSVRLFEAAACGAPIVSDDWSGLDSFFRAGREILLPVDAQDIVQYLSLPESQLRTIGEAAQTRVLSEHTSEIRAKQFEDAISVAKQGREKPISAIQLDEVAALPVS
ncbi:MAG TPA: glycosyltransferase [Terriglobales bacterium]|jgi:spore maturation protein CgeB|nr:glycosyltransferase [Terriglobales bacterium]